MLRRIIPALLLGSLAGAVLMFFSDPDRGNRRRKMAAQQLVGLSHRSTHQLARAGRVTQARLYALWQRLTHLKPATKPLANDETLTQRVRSQVLRDPALHHHRLNINTEQGTVVLRGEVDRPEQMRQLEQAVRHIPGVRGVENLLHLPNTPAPMSR